MIPQFRVGFPPSQRAQHSAEKGVLGFKAVSFRSAYWLVPLKTGALSVGTASAPGCPSVGELTMVRSRPAIWSANVVPDVSSRRQYAIGVSAIIAMLYWSIDPSVSTGAFSGNVIVSTLVPVLAIPTL